MDACVGCDEASFGAEEEEEEEEEGNYPGGISIDDDEEVPSTTAIQPCNLWLQWHISDGFKLLQNLY